MVCFFMLDQAGQTKLHTKGRLIFSSEKVLNFHEGRYEERTGVGAEYEDKAPVKYLVIKELKKGNKMLQELAVALNKDKGQLSNVCSSLENDGIIYRPDRTKPWSLVEANLLR